MMPSEMIPILFRFSNFQWTNNVFETERGLPATDT